MRANAEIRPEVLWYLDHECSQADALDFYKQFEWVLEDPIGRSKMLFEPEASRYVERWFPFGLGVERIASFRYDGHLLKVLRCRVSKPKRFRKSGAPSDDPHPGT